MTEYQSAHPLNILWSNQLAAIKSASVVAALKLGVFDALSEPKTLAETAKSLQLESQHLELLVKALVSLSLLETTANSYYQNTAASQRYLCRNSMYFCGDSFLFRHQSLGSFAKALPEQLKKPATAKGQQITPNKQWAQAAQVQLAQEQQAISGATALGLLQNRAEFKQASKLLDLGGGPGLIARQLADVNSDLEVTIFDLPESIAVAKQNFVDEAYKNRSHFLSGSFSSDSFGQGYDIIWCSSVFYFSENLPGLLNKLFKALKPGGMLVSVHAELPDNPQDLEQVYFYYLPLLMRGLKVCVQGELSQLMADAGFTEIEQQQVLTLPMTPMQCLYAKKPTVQESE